MIAATNIVAPRPTQAQARAAVIAKAAILDFATGLSAEEAATAIADALLATHGPDVVERIGDRISRAAHLFARRAL